MRLGNFFLCLACAGALAQGARADEPAMDPPFDMTRYGSQALFEPLRLAQTDGSSRTPALRLSAPATTPAEELPWHHKNNLHKWLGLGSITLAGLTLLAPKEEDGAHEYLAQGAAALGVGAVGTGIYAHWDDLEGGWNDPDFKHAILGTVGALGFVLAVSKAPEGGHSGAGAVGALAMAVAIKLTW